MLLKPQRRHAQAFEYGSKEFDDFHDHARISIESLNNQIKSGGTEDIQSSTRRRVRGFGAAGIIVAILVTNFNLRKIAAFISDKLKEEATRPQGPDKVVMKIRRRDREFHNPYTNTYPAGFGPNSHDKPTEGTALDTSDETGGPPRTQ